MTAPWDLHDALSGVRESAYRRRSPFMGSIFVGLLKPVVQLIADGDFGV